MQKKGHNYKKIKHFEKKIETALNQGIALYIAIYKPH
jgi:hypothetical protein